MKAIALVFVLLIIIPNYVYAQTVPDNVNEYAIALTKELSEGHDVVGLKILRSAEGKPSQDVIAQYNPKKVYCITCEVRANEPVQPNFDLNTREGMEAAMKWRAECYILWKKKVHGCLVFLMN